VKRTKATKQVGSGAPRTPLPRRDPEERAKDFEEVALGFAIDAALAEARRCLQCKRPKCVEGCPVGIDIPGFVQALAEERFEEAVRILKERNNLPGICGRVCPQESQCELACVLGKKHEPVAIGALERSVADWESDHMPLQPAHRPDPEAPKVAVIGSGPGGLTAAADLARYGYRVTLFESLHAPGGVLRYGIPEFRLPRAILDREVEYVKRLGVEIETDVLVGKTVTLDELREEGFAAFFVATGAGLPWFLGIPGENLAGVYSANEFLTRVNLMQAYRFPQYRTPVRVGRRTAVIGGGNTAMDSARSALRLGSQVALLYRRTRAEMPARAEEVENAVAEGVELNELTIPVQMLGDQNGHVRAVECLRGELGEPDASGRRRPVPVKDSEFEVPADTVIVAVSQSPNPLLPRTEPRLETREDGRLVVDPETGETSMPGVFAGGDISNDAGTVIAAMGDAKRGASAIHEYLLRRRGSRLRRERKEDSGGGESKG
jgi:glutamate synthase (NADPH/NADH) small chain